MEYDKHNNKSNRPITDREMPGGFDAGSKVKGVLFSADRQKYVIRGKNGRVEVHKTPENGTIDAGGVKVVVKTYPGDVRVNSIEELEGDLVFVKGILHVGSF